MKDFNTGLLYEYIETWTAKEKKLTIFGSAIFYFLLIINFFIELIHVENSLGLEKGFEGIGGINFLKSDLFFLIFTISIIFFEFFLYISYYAIKGPIKRILYEKSVDDLFKRRKKSCFLQKNLLYFFIIISIICILDNYIKIFFEILYQFIIIELFLYFIF